jgi:hypothetical protein
VPVRLHPPHCRRCRVQAFQGAHAPPQPPHAAHHTSRLPPPGALRRIPFRSPALLNTPIYGSSPQFVFISWVGEKVSALRKAKMSVHKADVKTIVKVRLAPPHPAEDLRRGVVWAEGSLS